MDSKLSSINKVTNKENDYNANMYHKITDVVSILLAMYEFRVSFIDLCHRQL